ncbi:MAG TPA: ABC transporter ATP-binding protein, partial [Mycobacteriales bacterium]|nr:ABC transporter ATP-binding protein [Mycobacteriales bacterium]
MSLAEAAVSVHGLRKTYGERTAVDGVDLDIPRGEVFALLGPNGAGKTTTVEILEGYRSRDAGEISVLGIDPADATPQWRARVGIVLQSVTDLSELTVAETVRHFAGYYPRPRDPDEVIATVGLTDSAAQRIRLLSGGQRRRLDVALGILGRPELLFLDEPTTGFDPAARRQFWVLVEDLAREGTTILLTTHYLEEAERLADRVAVIASGRIVEVAEPAALGGRRDAAATVSWT